MLQSILFQFIYMYFFSHLKNLEKSNIIIMHSIKSVKKTLTYHFITPSSNWPVLRQFYLKILHNKIKKYI